MYLNNLYFKFKQHKRNCNCQCAAVSVDDDIGNPYGDCETVMIIKLNLLSSFNFTMG